MLSSGGFIVDEIIWPEFYIKRGDAYASLKQSAKATTEYDRVSRAFPKYAGRYFEEKNGKRIRRRD
jgi:hypothetical protein